MVFPSDGWFDNRVWTDQRRWSCPPSDGREGEACDSKGAVTYGVRERNAIFWARDALLCVTNSNEIEFVRYRTVQLSLFEYHDDYQHT